MSTYLQKPADVQEKWYLVNAEGKTLGRLAARVAGMLRGKHRPTFTPNVDMGDHVVIINAEKVHLTGDKMETKLYRHHSGYPGGLKTATAKHVFRKDPTRLLVAASTTTAAAKPNDRIIEAMRRATFASGLWHRVAREVHSARRCGAPGRSDVASRRQ